MTRTFQPKTDVIIRSASFGQSVSGETNREILPPSGGGGELPENPSGDPSFTNFFFDAKEKTLVIQGSDFGYVEGDVENSFDGGEINLQNDTYAQNVDANRGTTSGWTALTEVHIPLQDSASNQLTYSAWMEGYDQAIETASQQTAVFSAGWTLHKPSHSDSSESITIKAQNVSYPTNIMWIRDTGIMVVRGHNFTVPSAGVGTEVIAQDTDMNFGQSGTGSAHNVWFELADAGEFISEQEWRIEFEESDRTSINAKWVTSPTGGLTFNGAGPGFSNYWFIAGGQPGTFVWDINNSTYRLNLDTDRALGISVYDTEGDLPITNLMQESLWTDAGAASLVYQGDYVWPQTPLLEREAFVAQADGTNYRLDVNGSHLSGLRPQYVQIEILTDDNAGSYTFNVRDTANSIIGTDSGTKNGTEDNSVYHAELTFGANDIGAIELIAASSSQAPAIFKIDLIFVTLP